MKKKWWEKRIALTYEMTSTEENSFSSMLLNVSPYIGVSCPVVDKVSLNILRKLCQPDNFFFFSHPAPPSSQTLAEMREWCLHFLMPFDEFLRKIVYPHGGYIYVLPSFFKKWKYDVHVIPQKILPSGQMERRGGVRSCRNCKIQILKIIRFKTCSWNNENNNLNIAVEFN